MSTGFIGCSQSDHDCSLARQALDAILAEHPHLVLRENPDRTSSIHHGYPGLPRPLTAEELLAKSTADCLNYLLSVGTTDWDEPERRDKSRSVAEATRQNFGWSIDLATALGEAEKWDVYVWSALINTWSEMQLDEAQQQQVFRWLVKTQLYSKHSYEVARALCELVKNNDSSYVLNLLPQANQIAAELWQSLDRTLTIDPARGWFKLSGDYPVWGLTNFWISAFRLWRKQQEPVPMALGDEYRQALSGIIKDSSQLGSLGKAILTSKLATLLAVDDVWTREHLLPLFEPDSDDFQAAWDGFVALGPPHPSVAEMMTTPFLKAVTRISTDLSVQRDSFVKSYTYMLINHAKDPLCQWIPKLFKYGSQNTPSAGSASTLFPRDNRTIADCFTSAMSSRLHNLFEAKQRELWQRWLKDYWQNRLEGVPATLESSEIVPMLNWVPQLTAKFPAAVDLAVQMPRVPLQDCRVLRDLSLIDESNLCQRYPEAVARLLIYLWNCDSRYTRDAGHEFLDSLLQSNISTELKQKLEDIKIQL